MPDTVVSTAEMVLREELAGRAEAADLLHGLCRGRPAAAKESVGWCFSSV